MQQVLTVVFLVECKAQSYDSADCTGSICAQLATGVIECIQDPTQGTLKVLPPQSYTDTITGNIVTAWGDVAINPIDGTIFVIYNAGSRTDKLGTIEDPLSGSGSFEVTPIGNLTQQQYTGMTFDCLGRLYGITALGSIYQFDYNTNTDIDSLEDNNIEKCHAGIDCRETLFYNYETKIFYRISSYNGYGDLFYTRTPINGIDQPVGPPAGITITTTDGLCGDAKNKQFQAGEYIGGGTGNEISIVGCHAENSVLLLTGTPTAANVEKIPNSALTNVPVGLWNYNDNGDICKPPSCTDAPTFNPTTMPTTQPSITPTAAPTGITDIPTSIPSMIPTVMPTVMPTATPGGDDDHDSEYSEDSEDGEESFESFESESLVRNIRNRTPTTTTTTTRSDSVVIVNNNVNRRINSGSGSDSDSDSDDDDALLVNKEYDNGFLFFNNSNNVSGNPTVNLGDKTIYNICGLFGVFTIVNIIVFWCCNKRINNNESSFVSEREKKTEIYID